MAAPSNHNHLTRGRLAPSPTGRMHIGHARSFLLAWWSIRAQGGEVLLRIEDLDQVRANASWTAGILEDLAWLGLDWDGEPVLQSEHLEATLAARDELVRAGHVYACVCSRREVREAASAPHEGQLPTTGEANYAGTCRGRFASVEEAEAQTGRPASLRFRVPDEPVKVLDRVRGAVAFALPHHGGDFVVMRRDGQPAYQLGVVVDDGRSGITEVLRGDDLLVSAARQQLLYRALGLPIPVWAHVPLVQDASGDRLAKRAGSTSLQELRDGGVAPAAIVDWAARSTGMEPRHETPGAYLDSFDLGALATEPAVWMPAD